MKDRNKNSASADDISLQERIIHILYKSIPGRLLLKILTRPFLSKAAGCFLDAKISTVLIPGFVKRNHIDMDDYVSCEYDSFNAFFTRKIKPDRREIIKDWDALIAPCDSRLTVYDIEENSTFMIKDRSYTMEELVRSKKLAKHYAGGQLLLFRLTVSDYHRYCYPDDGVKTKNYRIPGVLHTVNPIAAGEHPIYKENTREFSLLHTEHFGNVLMMEVGALLVGRIVNRDQEASVKRGEEAGMFEYGGSTVILCLEPGVASLNADIRKRSAEGIETVVEMGEQIGRRIS